MSDTTMTDALPADPNAIGADFDGETEADEPVEESVEGEQ
jgi:hypothetical protein